MGGVTVGAQARETELTQIGRDATLHSQSSDQQVANRLQLEVSNYMKDHHSAQDMNALTNRLRTGGLQSTEIQRLEQMGFPTPQIGDTHSATTNNGGAERHSNRSTTETATRSDDVDRRTEQGARTEPRPNTFHDVMNEVNQAEGNFNHHEPGKGADAQRSMQQALSDVQNYLRQHPEDAQQMIDKLQKNHLLEQLAVTSLNNAVEHKEASTGQQIPSLSRQDALQLMSGDQSDLGKALTASLDRSFSPQQANGSTPEGFKGRGYADAQRNGNGYVTEGSGGPGEQPVITRNHLRDLTQNHFDREPLPGNQQPDLDKDQPSTASQWLKRLGF